MGHMDMVLIKLIHKLVIYLPIMVLSFFGVLLSKRFLQHFPIIIKLLLYMKLENNVFD